jgi:hypothetical protein
VSLSLRSRKLLIDAAEKHDRIELEEKRLASQEEIAGMQIGAKLATAKNASDAKQQEAGLRMGMDVAKAEMDQTQEPMKLKETPSAAYADETGNPYSPKQT